MDTLFKLLLAALSNNPVASRSVFSRGPNGAFRKELLRAIGNLGGRDRSTMAAPLVARASPTREFFVNMLTRDIELRDCILDLVDNCIDGAHRNAGSAVINDPNDQAYKGYGCEIKLSRGSFEISDNCGGIPLAIARDYAGVPEWHNQYSGFRGLVFFRSPDAGLLPWTTTKRNIDRSSEVYRRALVHMRVLSKVWTSYTNKRKSDIDRAKAAERDTKSVSVLSVHRREQMRVPKMQSAKKPVANILYNRPLSKVERVRKALGDVKLSNRDVGIQTFEYFYKREVDG